MSTVFDVAPYDGGWCVKIAATGEVLFFSARRRAIAEARSLSKAWPTAVEVRVHERATSFETWAPDDARPSAFPYPLGAPA